MRKLQAICFLALALASSAHAAEPKLPVPAGFPPVIHNDQERDAACAIWDQMDHYEKVRRKNEPNMAALTSLCIRRGNFKPSSPGGW